MRTVRLTDVHLALSEDPERVLNATLAIITNNRNRSRIATSNRPSLNGNGYDFYLASHLL